MAGNLFYYIGDDEAYFRALQGEFSRNTRMAATFQRLYEKDESRIQSLFIKIYQNKPVCVFVDLSKNTQDYLHLARLIARTNFDHKIITVGLVDYLSPEEILLESIATGINLTHIKSAETYDVAFDVSMLLAPDAIGEHGFAKASLKEEWEAGVPCKVGHINANGLHLETNHRVSKGDVLSLRHHWMEKKIVPSKQVIVSEVSTTNLFYQFALSADVEFLFVDEFIPREGMEEDEIKERLNERSEAIKNHKKALTSWIEDNLSRSQEKKAKVLIIDREFTFYQDQKRTDKHPYTIRCAAYIKDIVSELDRMQPQVIAISLEEEGKDSKNNLAFLQELCNTLNSNFPNLKPFLVVFNSQIPSKDLQSQLGYEQSMATSNPVSVDVLVRMAAIFEKKMAESMVIGTKVDDKLFIKKNNLASLAEILIKINVSKLSETDVIFTSDTNLPVGINISLTKPVRCYLQVQMTKTQGKSPEYHGLIHCLGEEEKKELRKYVNSIFFRDHDAQLNTEAEEFKKLNELKLQEKQDALKKQQEEAAAAKDDKPAS